MAISSIFFFIGANFLGFLSLNIAGNTQSVSVVEAILDMGFFNLYGSSAVDYFISITVFITGIVTPLLLLLLMLSLLVPLQLGYAPKRFKQLYKNYMWLRVWAMADVYILAVCVSLVKLFGIGEVVIGDGLFMFMLFLISFYSAYVWFNPHDLWIRYEMEN